jgi:hypothetical protein
MQIAYPGLAFHFRMHAGIGKSTPLKAKENQTQLKVPVNFTLA